MSKQTTAIKTSGSVFESLGFSPAEAENLRVRAAMMNVLINHLHKRALTQTRAARLLGITQPRVSDLMRGKIDLFSIDTLINLLAAAGLRVDFRVRDAA